MRYVNVHAGTNLPDLSDLAPFLAVVVVEQPVAAPQQAEISGRLVAMGCRYVVACGKDCDSWVDAVRAANLQAVDIDHMTPRDFVMTTSHPRERLRSVFAFAKKAASHPEVTLDDTVVIHLAATDRSTEYQALFLQS